MPGNITRTSHFNINPGSKFCFFPVSSCPTRYLPRGIPGAERYNKLPKFVPLLLLTSCEPKEQQGGKEKFSSARHELGWQGFSFHTTLNVETYIFRNYFSSNWALFPTIQVLVCTSRSYWIQKNLEKVPYRLKSPQFFLFLPCVLISFNQIPRWDKQRNGQTKNIKHRHSGHFRTFYFETNRHIDRYQRKRSYIDTEPREKGTLVYWNRLEWVR